MIIDAKPAQDLIEFLEHSNLIEGVTDADSLEQALTAWQYLVAQKKLNHSVILKTHKILMLNHLPTSRRGLYRKDPVGIYRNGKIVKEFIDPQLVSVEMDRWLFLANKVTTADYPDEWAKLSHVQFENIHPFYDGNGRVGRMLLNWQRLQAKLPILIIREEERSAYYQWFK